MSLTSHHISNSIQILSVRQNMKNNIKRTARPATLTQTHIDMTVLVWHYRNTVCLFPPYRVCSLYVYVILHFYACRPKQSYTVRYFRAFCLFDIICGSDDKSQLHSYTLHQFNSFKVLSYLVVSKLCKRSVSEPLFLSCQKYTIEFETR